MITLTITKDQSVLVVDDNPCRLAWFKECLPNCTTAASPEKALNILGTHTNWDVIFLDHDAGGHQMVDEDTHPGSTFMPVANRLAKMEFSGLVVIHSLNYPGAKRMQHILGRTAKVTIIPIINLKIVEG